MEPYKDQNLSLEERTEDLLSRMTLKEKVGQLNQKIFGWNAYEKNQGRFEVSQEFKEEVAIGDGLGALYGLFRSDPWSGVTYENGIPLECNAKVANMLQRYVIENTRLGIPILISEECPHGHQALDSMMLPTNIGIGSTWNPTLYQEALEQVGAEIRSRGGNLGLVSTLDVLQDPRWGRSEECYSEDPYLGAKMCTAAVRGLQGYAQENLRGTDKVGAVVKHFCGQGASIGGHNGKGAPIGERELREIHLPGMKAAVESGAVSCMAAYNEIDGVFCHANEKLLTGILRGEWNFQGVVMSDGCAVDNLVKIAGGYEEAVAMALQAGVDLNLWNISYTKLEVAVQKKKVNEELIDRAVRRVLMLKFKLGLFENPYTDEKLAARVVNNKRAKEINRKVARESIVLLKNEGNILPLQKDLESIAVIGPNADSVYNQLGDYTAIQAPKNNVTIQEGIQSIVGHTVEILSSRGCGIRDNSREGFHEAIEKARKADVIILALGGSSARNFDIQFDVNGAALISGQPTEMDCGEGVDVANLELGGVQVELAQEMMALGKPVIVVLIQGRPYAIPWIAEHCPGILCGWYPGQEGGRAIAEVLFGEVTPSGKLPASIPRSAAQLPVYYNYKDTSDYIDMPASPLYPFGFGLSYTTFEYKNVQVDKDRRSLHELNEKDRFRISVEVKNTGKYSGAEVVQCYIQDMESSINRRIKELKGFEKIWLEPGEIKNVIIELGKEELGIWNTNMEFVLEPGNFKVMIGTDSKTWIQTMVSISE